MKTIITPIWSYLNYLVGEWVRVRPIVLIGKQSRISRKSGLLSCKIEKEEANELTKLKQDVFPETVPSNITATWITNKVAGTINPQIFNGFIHGLLPGFRLKGFIDPTEAGKIATAIRGFVEEYKTAPGIGRAGETLVEHPHDFDTYAEFAAILRDSNISIPFRLELADKITSFLIRNTNYQYRPLKNGNIELFWGVFRQINIGAGWHLDNVTNDSDAFMNHKIIFQGSVVLHIVAPNQGGETIIANRKAQEGDIKFLNYDGWTYDENLLRGVHKAEVPAVAGDLVFLSTLNYHMVKPCLEIGAERISFSMFFVIFENEPNTMYYYN